MSQFRKNRPGLQRGGGFVMTIALWAATMACDVTLAPPTLTPTFTPSPAIVASLVGATLTPVPIQSNLPTATATEDEDSDDVPIDLPAPATVVGTGTPEALNVCNLLTEAEVVAVLGEPIVSTHQMTDTDEGVVVNSCSWVGQTPGRALVLAVAELNTSGEAVKKAEDQIDPDQSTEDVKAEKAGLGERAYWTVTEHASGFVVVTSNYVYNLALGGEVEPTANHDLILKAALLVTGRL